MNSILIFGAKYLFYFLPIFAGIYFLMQSRDKQKRMLILAIISVPLTYIVVFVLNHTIFDPRPFVVGNFTPLVPHDPDNGFPSDHAVFTSLVASIIYPFNKKLSLGLFALAILVSVSRVYIGLHHSMDVIGGGLISIVMTTLSFWFIELSLKQKLEK